MSQEVEVFRLTRFDTSKCYEYATETKAEGIWPNQKYYALTPLQYLGTYMYSERWGSGDSRGGAENFKDLEGNKRRIVYDYDGMICFREVQAREVQAREVQAREVQAREVQAREVIRRKTD